MKKQEVFNFLNSGIDKSGYLKKEIGFKKKFPELYDEFLNTQFPSEIENLPFKQKLWHFLKEDYCIHTCKICGNEVSFESNTQLWGYKKYCSGRCANRDKMVRDKIKQTCIEKYGEDYYSKTFEYKNRVKETCIEKYGVDSYLKTNEFKDKLKHTCLDKYNSEYYLQSNDYKEKSKKTLFDKYGVENIFQDKSCKEKIKQTNLKKYGVENYAQTNEYIYKFKKTCLEKYGVESFSQTNEFAKYHRKQIEYNGLTFDSSWEIIVYQYCKENNIPCEYQPDITFEYEYDGKKHYYHPDFLINGKLYEVKGGQFFDGNKMINPYDRTQDGLYEAKHQCMIKNDVIILNNISNEVINKILKGEE